MLFIAHRGESLDAPENTLSAFSLAYERNCPCIECDVRRTSDGEIICMHDDNTLRTTGIKRSIGRTSYEKLWRLDAGAWKDRKWEGEVIPKLSDVLSELPADGRIYIEVKDSVDTIEPLIKVVANAPVSRWQITIVAFDREVVAKAKHIFHGVKVLWLVSFKDEAGTISPDADELIASLRELRADGVDVQASDMLTEEYVRKVHDAGFSFHVWTVDDEKQAKRFIDYGVDSITSNRAAELSMIFNQI